MHTRNSLIGTPSTIELVDALSLKDEFLSLLEKDKEFRYAVAGLLGLEKILARLDRNE